MKDSSDFKVVDNRFYLTDNVILGFVKIIDDFVVRIIKGTEINSPFVDISIKKYGGLRSDLIRSKIAEKLVEFDVYPTKIQAKKELINQWEKISEAYIRRVKEENEKEAQIAQNELEAEENKKELRKGEEIKNILIKLDNYIENAEHFYRHTPYFYDKSKIWWFWNDRQKRYEIKDDTDVMIMIDRILGLEGQTVNSSIKNNYLEAFKRTGRINIPKDPPVKWVQFKDKAISIKSQEVYDVTPDYFFTNPIPHEIGKSDKTPVMDKLFKEWVGEKYVKDLYEIIAYCCYRDYPIQTFICLYGYGRNGKSQFLKILNRFFGLENVCSTELDLLAGNNSSRFEVFKLYKKLVCMLGETNFGLLNSTSLLKRLVGGDVIGFEKKGKDPFDDFNYAKILISSNSLPTSNDTSDGYMRRWFIIDFPNEFPEGKDIIDSIPEEEYRNLALKIKNILPELIDRGSFTNQGSIDVRKERYMMVSNPLPIFIKECCDKDIDNYILYNRLYTNYVHFLAKNKKRKVSMKEFRSALEDDGFYVEKTTKKELDDGTIVYKSGFFVIGLKMKENYDNYDNYTKIPTRNPIGESNSNLCHKSHNCHKQDVVVDKVGSIQDVENSEKFGENKKSNVFEKKELLYNLLNLYRNEGMEIEAVKKAILVDDSLIKKWIEEGLIFENRSGRICLLE